MSEPSLDYLTPGEVLRMLGEHRVHLDNQDLIRWVRNKSLSLLEGEVEEIEPKTGKTKGVRFFYRYRSDVLPKIYRLYHYDKERRLAPEQYKCYANLKGFQQFLMLVGDCQPGNAIKMLRHLHSESQGLLRVKCATLHLRSSIQCIALCECADQTDTLIYTHQYAISLRNLEGPQPLQLDRPEPVRWMPIIGEPFQTVKFREGYMRAVLLISAVSGDPNTKAEHLVQAVKATDGVLGAAVVYGDADIVAIVEAKDELELSDIIVERLRPLVGILKTETYVVAHGYDYLDFPPQYTLNHER